MAWEKKIIHVFQGELKPEEKECAADVREFEKFISADEAPIACSPKFTEALRKKLWNMLRNKSYVIVVLALSMFL
ncbi:MAG: hypothetical protein R3231_03460, partial [bacterium]|nr:hypothetical protein [bacterium]